MSYKIQNINLSLISDKDHGYENCDIKNEWKYYEKIGLISFMNIEGKVNPVILLKKNKKYLIFDGWHRIEIAKKLKWKTIPAIIFMNEEDITKNWKNLKELGYITE